MMMMMMTAVMMMAAMMMMVCDHEYDDDNDNDIQVSCVFIPRRPLMCYLYELNIVGGKHFLYLCYC